MDYVVRRKTPNPRGARYFNANGPAQGHVSHATRFTEDEANAARRALKEPHLWEVLHVSDAAAMDMKIAVDLKREMAAERRDPRMRTARSLLMLGAAASASLSMPPMPRRGS